MNGDIPRMTAATVQKLLKLNEGFQTSTAFTSKNLSETRHYVVKSGKVIVRSVGKTSWAASRYDIETVADPDQVRRFLKSVYNALPSKGLK